MSKYIYPLKLSFYPKETVWGGSKLSTKYKKGSCDKLGETWELSVRNDAVSVITNGACAGMPLGEYIATHTDNPFKDFPLLIKFIDAKDKLSVQVHPDDHSAALLGEPNGKTEMWYIIDADENASIVYGTAPGTTQDDLRRAIESGTLEKHLNYVNVSAGDVFFIPGGLIHAIGSGILVAEIQQNSDTTYRFYDYDRKDADGNKRPLHIEQAFDSLKNFTDDEIEAIRFSKRVDSDHGTALASCDFFTVVKHSITDSEHFELHDLPFISLLCLDGQGIISWQGGSEALNAGDSFYIPSSLTSFDVSGSLTLLSTTV